MDEMTSIKAKDHHKNINKANMNYEEVIENRKEIDPKRATFRIMTVYLIIGFAWVWFSDGLVSFLIEDPNLLLTVQVYKGWIYVATTALIFYLIILDKMKIFRLFNDRIYDTYLELSSINNKLKANEKELQDQISLLNETREELVESNQKNEIIIEGSNNGIWYWDFKTGESFFSLPYKERFGFSKSDKRSSREIMIMITHPDHREERNNLFKWHTDNSREIFDGVFKILDKDGNYRWIASRGRIKYDEDGHVIYAAGSHTDITEEKLLKEKLYHQAYYDTLTNLPNKSYLNNRLEELLERDTRNEDSFGLAFIDIDGFRNINETMGYKAGDSLICHVANLIGDMIKLPNELACLGGDEFALIFLEGEEEEMIRIVDNVIKQARRPWIHENQSFPFTLSAGLSIYPKHGRRLQTILQNTDLALSNSKQTGKDKYSFYTKDMSEAAWRNVELNNELNLALENEEFKLHYQPQIDIKTNEIIGVEALIRWHHPKKGLISPMEFIPFAEKTGQIVNIGKWVFREACRQKREWINKGKNPLKISVNLSTNTLMSDNIIQYISQVLDEYNIQGPGLEIEITETSIMKDVERSIGILKEFKDLGLTIALDDFGSGYSSLTYLRELPIDILKIDRKFISGIPEDERDSFITRTIIDLSHSLNLKVLAEGVETQEQLDFLKNNDCEYVQGFYFYKPMPLDELENLLGY